MTRVFALVGISLTLGSVTAAAQGSPSDMSITTFNPEDATAPVSAVEGPGIKVGEGTVLHPVFGLETGVVSNVFYETQAEDPNGAAVLRLLAQIGTASLSKDRLESPDGLLEDQDGSLQYRADLRLSYDLMLSGNDVVQETGGLGVGALLKGMANPHGTWSFSWDENFNRLIRAANFETDANTNRDLNDLQLAIHYHPQSRALSGYLYYQNRIDVFESDNQRFADRWSHRGGLHPAWRVFPNTVVYGDFSWGITTGLGSSSMKVTSYPLIAEVGLATLLSLRTTLNVHAGYTNGFYSTPPNYSAPIAGIQLGYRYSPAGRVALTYDYLHQDSINANFYRDHILRLWVQQLFVPFAVMVQPEIHFRRYEGITLVMGEPTRDDVIYSVIAGVHYNFRNWLAATLNYRFSSLQTDYTYTFNGLADDPSYVRHELLLGMRAAL